MGVAKGGGAARPWWATIGVLFSGKQRAKELLMDELLKKVNRVPFYQEIFQNRG